jgi:hypothetical protein
MGHRQDVTCNECGRSAGPTEAFLGCAMCDYDICPGCTRRGGPGSGGAVAAGNHHQSRERRLADGETRTLYHQTSREAAVKIVASQQFHRGDPSCAVGSGIYFAVSVADTDRKARHTGTVLSASVRLGRVKTLSEAERTTFADLQREGYDCVRLTCFNGDEYVVYNWDQATDIRVVRE